LGNTEYKIAFPIDGTCEWIFKAGKFISWLDNPDHSKVLCIHGSLGSGKSTLMRHIVMSLKQTPLAPKRTIAAVFNIFSEDDVPHNGPAEIYRSLLFQILQSSSYQEEASKLVGTYGARLILKQEVQGYEQELCKILKDLFRSPGLSQTDIFIDAVEKCTNPDRLVQFFQDIIPVAPRGMLKICFTTQQTIRCCTRNANIFALRSTIMEILRST
jgi:hypothetical protein